MVDKMDDALKAAELAHKRSLQEVAIKTELLAKNAVTRQEVLKAETEADIAATRVEEARKEQTLARLNLEDCTMKAPFTGYLAVRYKQPFETVMQLEKVFAMVDTSCVLRGHVYPGTWLLNSRRDLQGRIRRQHRSQVPWDCRQSARTHRPDNRDRKGLCADRQPQG